MRPIDADALVDQLEREAADEWNRNTPTNWANAFCVFVDRLDEAPAIDAEWELFQRITDAYYDKQMFFLQDDGSVYDREEAVYHSSTDAAIDAFIRRISEGEDDWYDDRNEQRELTDEQRKLVDFIQGKTTALAKAHLISFHEPRTMSGEPIQFVKYGALPKMPKEEEI